MQGDDRLPTDPILRSKSVRSQIILGLMRSAIYMAVTSGQRSVREAGVRGIVRPIWSPRHKAGLRPGLHIQANDPKTKPITYG